MTYQIIQLEEKKIVGLAARTSNLAPDMGQVIGNLWNRFYGEGIYESIKNKCTQTVLGIYTDYEKDEKGSYSVLVACQVSKADELHPEAVSQTIPAGKYARFIVKGNRKKAVAECWQKIWNMELSRSFVSDFEEYQNAEEENAEVHIYIGLKE